MSQHESYWTRRLVSRRSALRAAVAGGAAFGALSLVGCGGGGSDSGGGTSGGGGKADEVDKERDSKKGTPGGKLVFQAYADWGGTQLVTTANQGIHQGASLTHSSLYQYAAGRPGVDRRSADVELDLAIAMPEQPDPETHIVKIRQDAKFSNGKPVTAEDVAYSYDRYAFAANSAYKTQYQWLDKVQAVDRSTVKFSTKGPFADFIGVMANYISGHVQSKEFEESKDAETKFMGSGPYLLTDRTPPVLNGVYKRNPEYYDKPWPYFDTIEVLGTSDNAKKIADFTSRQTHVMYWLFEEDRDTVAKSRPDAKLFTNQFPGYSSRPRVDIKPFNDKRLRQAFSMAIDRKKLNDATAKGRGEDDQWFSWTVPKWGFRKPSQLPQKKYWEHDLAEAKKLFAAAGYSAPIEFTYSHWNASVIGQALVDQATLVSAMWQNAGFAKPKDVELTFTQTAGTTSVGNYEGIFYGAGSGGTFSFYPGLAMRNAVFSPPEGVTTPTPNIMHINNPRLSELVTKQMQQLNLEERKQTFKEMEEIFAEEQYAQMVHTVNNNWFMDPSLRNIQAPLWMTNGPLPFLRYSWFEGGKAP
jgi:ABC-type transport system substrate-binding protein